MVAFEVMHYLKRKTKGKKCFMALKLDMSKACDRVEWDYLRLVMARIGFSERWINLIMACVNSVFLHLSRSLNLNDFYKDARWLMRHHLSLICSLQTIAICFVNQLLVLPAVSQTCSINFETASGQKVNFSKSIVFFSPNMCPATRVQICDILHMSEASEGSLYLGLPNIIGRNKNVVLRFLKTKVIARIDSWDAKLLSRADKEILLKSVIQSLPTYAMSVYLLPLGTCKEIEKLMARFWWKTSYSKGKGIIWRSWIV
ncbi:uncharacterized protein LOC133031303 [Cannabis sativa]|uniref:uncharacterized protein LOC133031303 n=1 Tax=Cannabis sativa TaxID=3483 RepID=UPI0029CA85BB|nr:uncharacterized protein LOC133031303 [Cannabis sativa]